MTCWRLYYFAANSVAVTLADYRKRKLMKKKLKRNRGSLLFFLKNVKGKKKIRRKLKSKIKKKCKISNLFPIKMKS